MCSMKGVIVDVVSGGACSFFYDVKCLFIAKYSPDNKKTS